MRTTVQIDTSRANFALIGLREAMVGKGMDASNIVVDELRFLSRTIVNFTPPLGPGGRAAGAREAGEGAINRELKNLISEAKPEFLSEVSAKWGLKDVHGFVESSQKAPLAINFANLDLDGSRLPELHEQYRNPRTGKVQLQRSQSGTWNARVLTSEGSRQPFTDKLIDRVGMWKASWAYASTLVGAIFPRWISRHLSAVIPFAIADLSHARDPEKPYVIFGSRFAGGHRIRAQVNSAVQFRARKIAQKIKLILSDYKRDVAQGIRAQAAAGKRREGEPVVT